MIRNLLVIAGAALVLCAITLGGAAALGGRDLEARGWDWSMWDDGDNIRVARADLGPATSRRIAWTGTDTLTSTVAADVVFIQGDEAGVLIEGPKILADRVVVDEGRLSLTGDGMSGGWDDDNLRITVTAPAVTRFRLEGSQDLILQNFNQPELSIELSGSGEVDGVGQTQTLSVAISGSGDVDLEELRASDATVSISGSGDARISPTTSASVNISGSGDVTLTTRPATVTSAVTGSGEVTQN